MTACINIIQDRETHKNWSKLFNFYTMLSEIACGGVYQSEYFLKKFEIVTLLCDHMLQKLSPKCKEETVTRFNMGGSKGNNAKFEPLVTLVSHLVRCMRTKAMDEDVHT